MFDDDADDSRGRAEQGRKNAAFRDFYESVKLDIKTEADAGNNRTTYTISQSTKEFVEPAIERLTESGYEAKFEDGPRAVLRISWEQQQE